MSKQDTVTNKYPAIPNPGIPEKARVSDGGAALSSSRLLELYGRVTDAPDAVERLRKFVLDLAVRGKLIEQEPRDEPAEELLKCIATDKAQLIKVGKMRRPKPLDPITECELPFQLPHGWAWSRLGTLVDLVSGQHLQPPEYSEDPGAGIPYITGPSDFGDNGLRIRRYALVRKAVAVRGQLLLTVKGSGVGKTTICDVDEVAISRQLMALTAISWNSAFLELVADRLARKLQEEARSLIPGISRSDVANFVVALPPLAEQDRIVSKVDDLMALLDRLETSRTMRESARDRLTTASLASLTAPTTERNLPSHARFALDNLCKITRRRHQINTLRQTILSLAVRGKLVEQDPIDEPAQDLLLRIAESKTRLGIGHSVDPLNGDELPFSLQAGWSWTRLGEICSKTGSGSTPRGGKAIYRKSGIPLLRSQNIHNDGLRLDDVAFIDPVIHERMKATRVLPGDLLLNITGGSIGRCCRVPDDFAEANVSQHVAIVRPAVTGMAEFLHKLILSPYFQSFIFNAQTGAGRGGLPKNRMDRIAVALPPLPEQRRIVAKVDALLALCDRMKSALTKADTNNSRLLQCLLDALLSEEDQKREPEPV